ncbi:MAG: PH domain-containing protein [Candidatus Hodarchaeota archaeon]
MNEVRIIKGSDIPPPPGKPRIIRPSRNLLLKNYLLYILVFIIFTAALVIIFTLFGWWLGPELADPQREILYQAFLWMGVIYMAIWFGITICYVVGMRLYVKSMLFIVHGHEIVVHKGIINKSEKHVPYRTVTNINMKTGPFDRVFGIGTIEIQTAGGKGYSLDETAEEKLEGIKVYREVRDYILTQLRQFQAAYGTVITKEEEPVQSIPDQMLIELKEIKKVLTTRLEGMDAKLEEMNKKLEKSQKPY